MPRKKNDNPLVPGEREFTWSAFESEAIERLRNGDGLGGRDALTVQQLAIHFDGRLELRLNLGKNVEGEART